MCQYDPKLLANICSELTPYFVGTRIIKPWVCCASGNAYLEDLLVWLAVLYNYAYAYDADADADADDDDAADDAGDDTDADDDDEA